MEILNLKINYNMKYEFKRNQFSKNGVISTTKKFNSEKDNINIDKCYLSPINSNVKISHLIITRFLINFWKDDNFENIIYQNDYIINGIRVMKKYLFPSLENQTCKKFIWILLVGDKANITYIETLFDFNLSFEYKIIYQKHFKKYIKNITKDSDILITTRIDFDDRIYYDAVNDVRKAINIKKPVLLYGYNSGVHYYESENKYYLFNISYHNEGVMSIFISLILVLNMVNDTYIVYDLGVHNLVRKTLLKSYKSFGINEINYEPAIFDSGEVKFVWVRHNYSGTYSFSNRIKNKLQSYDFNLNKFYGK